MHDTKNPPGQSPGYKHGPARPSRGPDRFKRLGEYIDHVHKSEEVTERLNGSGRLTFDEWWKTSSFPWMDSVPKHWFEIVWKAAQAHK